ncbi:hypothetical protein N9P53_03205 [Flavobacteriaceae bacterium]|nr:hypothetical protein [Flavobacteriaceae bacterium]
MKHFLNPLFFLLLVISCGKDSPETVESVITFNLTVTSSTGGKVSSSGGPFESGSNVSITATPDSEYVFVNWSNGSTDNPLSVTVNSNQTITSNFEKKKYPLTVSITGSGTVSEKIISAGKTTTEYTSGSTIQLTATPSQDWSFLGWSGSVSSTENPIQLTVNESKSIEASFKTPTQYTLTVIAGDGGTVSAQGGTYDNGTELTIIALPNEGYTFIGWKENESTQSSLTFTLNSNTTLSASFAFLDPNYAMVSFDGNGTYIRQNSPYKPLSYDVELLEGKINEQGNYFIGSKIRLRVQQNKGWELDYNLDSTTELAMSESGITVNENITFNLNVKTSMDSFPFNELNSDGSFLNNVGANLGAYSDWNEQNNELNYYVTDGFFYPNYIEAYKDRLYEIRQLLGNWGPLDILIFDWDQNIQQNRSHFLETRVNRAEAAYKNQIISNKEVQVENDMQTYDRLVSENGWPIGNSDAPMGSRKQIGQIFKNNTMDFLTIWANAYEISVNQLVQSNRFHWEWDSVAYHEYIHIWQASQNRHGFINDMASCHNCNPWTERDPSINEVWISPRWFQEGQCSVIQSILGEKMQYRMVQANCCTFPIEVFTVRNYIQKLLNQSYSTLTRDGTGRNGYFELGEVAALYKFAKMNHSLEHFMEFEVVRGSLGYAAAMQEFLGMSELDFYNEFNTWYFDTGLTNEQMLDFLYPVGTNPIIGEIQKRR